MLSNFRALFGPKSKALFSRTGHKERRAERESRESSRDLSGRTHVDLTFDEDGQETVEASFVAISTKTGNAPSWKRRGRKTASDVDDSQTEDDETAELSVKNSSEPSFDVESSQVEYLRETKTDSSGGGLRRRLAGSSTRKVPDDTERPIGRDELRSLPERSSSIFWRQVPAESLFVRGHDYLQSKKKVPSGRELYECVRVDFFQSQYRLGAVSPHVDLPEANFGASTPATWHAPDVFVVTLSLPSSPSAGKNDGPCNTICMYFVMTKETRDILTRLNTGATDEHGTNSDHPRVAAVRLFDEWCRRAPTDPKFQARFKLIPKATNLDDLGLPHWIARWNGKPVLIKRSGTTGFLHQQHNCMEMEVSLHPFPWAAKQALQYFREHVIKHSLLSIGFVLEGRKQSELPETIIGACQLCYPDPEVAEPVNGFSDSAVNARSLFAGEWRQF